MNAEAAPLTAARKRKTRWAIVAVVALVLAIGAAIGVYLLKPKTSSTAGVATATVGRQTLKILVSGTGTAVVAESVSVSPEIGGTVEELYVSVGTTVTAGQELYRISTSDADAQLLQAKASLLQSKQSKLQATQSYNQAKNQLYSAQTSLIQAEQNLDKLESQPATTPNHANDITIAKRQVVSAKAGVSSAKTSVSGASIGVQVASANLSTAQNSYDDAVDSADHTTVTAPIAGVVTALPISVGSQVSAGSTSSSSSGGSGSGGSSAMGGSTTSSASSSSSSSGSAITISDMSSLRVDVSVSEADVAKVTIGQAAQITFDAISDKTFTGKVSSVSPNGTSSSGVVSYDVAITLDAQDPRLKPDMTATADIETQVASNVLVVPSAAIKSSGDAKYVMLVGQGGATTQQKITTGVSDDTYTEVKSGLTEGATISTGASTTCRKRTARGARSR